jgi:hypothetical protein
MNESEWNTGDMIPVGKAKYSDRNLPQCHFVHQKPHTDWPRVEARPLQLEASR